MEYRPSTHDRIRLKQRRIQRLEGDSVKRKSFIEEAVACAKRNTNKGFAASVFMSEYNDVNARFRIAEVGGQPYTMCGMMVMAQVSRWAENKNLDPTKVLYMIERRR